jgi:hypothetical protein
MAYTTISLKSINNKTYGFYGKRFGFDNKWYLSATHVIPELTLEEINTAKFPTISAYRLPNNIITTINDNMVSIGLSSNYLSLSGTGVFITANDAGWAASTFFFII